jgi:hypothetical protein
MQLDPTITAIASAACATIFVGSAAMKFSAPMEFRSAVENYRIVPEWGAGAVVWFVPMLELAGAAGMVASATRGAAAALLLSLIAVFSAAIALNLARGRREIDCGCFGSMLRQRLSPWLIARNATLALLVAVAAEPRDARRLLPLDYMTIIATAAALVLLYAAANYLLANAPMIAALRTRDA